MILFLEYLSENHENVANLQQINLTSFPNSAFDCLMSPKNHL